MDVTDRDIANIRRISEEIFGDRGDIEIEEVKDTRGDVMVQVRSVDGEHVDVRNAFAGERLRTYHKNGYVAVAVGGGDRTHSAWFERADAIDFGSPEPSGEHDLDDGWLAVVGNSNVVLKHEGTTVAHVSRDGWTHDNDTMYTVIPASVAQDLYDIGFERGDVETDD